MPVLLSPGNADLPIGCIEIQSQARCLCYSPLGTPSPSSALLKSNTPMRRLAFPGWEEKTQTEPQSSQSPDGASPTGQIRRGKCLCYLPDCITKSYDQLKGYVLPCGFDDLSAHRKKPRPSVPSSLSSRSGISKLRGFLIKLWELSLIWLV